jgi:hypothetical protein
MVAVWLNIWSNNFKNTGDWFLSNLFKYWYYRSVWRQCHLIAWMLKYRLFIVEQLSICSAYDFLLKWCTLMQIVCPEVRCIYLIRASLCCHLCNTKLKGNCQLCCLAQSQSSPLAFQVIKWNSNKDLGHGGAAGVLSSFLYLGGRGAPFPSKALTVLLGWAGLLDYAQIGWFCAVVTCPLCFVNSTPVGWGWELSEEGI